MSAFAQPTHPPSRRSGWGEGPSRLRVEHERALQRVVALDVEVDADQGVLRAVARRFSDEYRRAGHGGENRIRERGGRAACALVRLELGIAGVADLDRPAATLNREGQRH